MSITVNQILGENSLLKEEKIRIFETALLDTKRQGIQNVIDFCRKTDFYTAPSSTKFHSNYAGGLLDHSLLVYSLAEQYYNIAIQMKPELANVVSRENIIISALLHDICKVSYYKEVTKWRKDINNAWESYIGYEVSDPFPIGHGEKSVIVLQNIGLSLEIEEMLAIRYHMGMWTHTIDCGDEGRQYLKAIEMCPLCLLIQNADITSSMMLENKI